MGLHRVRHDSSDLAAPAAVVCINICVNICVHFMCESVCICMYVCNSTALVPPRATFQILTLVYKDRV